MSQQATLYVFNLSVWAAAAELAAADLGYSDAQVKKETVNLVNGDNFAPSFVKLNPNATLPTLAVGDKVYTTTTDVVDYLVKHASRKVTSRTEITSIVHEDQYDPNFPLFASRDEAELKEKSNGFAQTFASNRQASLVNHSVTTEAAGLKEFYDAKKAGNGGLLDIFQGKASGEAVTGFIKQSQDHWDHLREFILNVLPKALPPTGFFGGATPGEDDYHVAAWLARITHVTGGVNTPDGINVLEKELHQPVPARVVEYWTAWVAQPSWKQVYAEGLH